ncbi:MAG: hypothetical protein HMLKMBBP_00629 [Planctomycetes bacterium]|nr:hypothetical protein [Planctomycetota bacterium]
MLRAAAAGLSFDEAGDVLRVDGATARKHVRTVIRLTGGSPPAASADDDALRAALAPALAAAAASPPARPRAIRCPEDSVAAELASARLDAALMLPHAEHAADCPACMARLVRFRRGGAPAAVSGHADAPPPERVDVVFWLGVAAGVAVALAYLFLR